MVSPPRVSIGLPVYNGERYLGEAIEALLGQTYEDFELIISDNASTDQTSAICRSYQRKDERIRYFRQATNIGLAPNHNFVMEHARGALFKCAHYDDLCARTLLERCIDALDRCPEAVLAYTGTVTIDEAGKAKRLVQYTTSTSERRAPDRFRRMLFDGWGDYYGGVVRRPILRRMTPHGSYHFADRVLLTELGLYGPFVMVPECLHFRRAHSEQAGRQVDMRERCIIMDPRRANRLQHPAIRLYAEYLWGYVRAINSAPLSPVEKRECYRVLAQWSSARLLPVGSRALRRTGLRAEDSAPELEAPLSLEDLVAGRAQ